MVATVVGSRKRSPPTTSGYSNRLRQQRRCLPTCRHNPRSSSRVTEAFARSPSPCTRAFIGKHLMTRSAKAHVSPSLHLRAIALERLTQWKQWCNPPATHRHSSSTNHSTVLAGGGTITARRWSDQLSASGGFAGGTPRTNHFRRRAQTACLV